MSRPDVISLQHCIEFKYEYVTKILPARGIFCNNQPLMNTISVH